MQVGQRKCKKNPSHIFPRADDSRWSAEERKVTGGRRRHCDSDLTAVFCSDAVIVDLNARLLNVGVLRKCLYHQTVSLKAGCPTFTSFLAA